MTWFVKWPKRCLSLVPSCQVGYVFDIVYSFIESWYYSSNRRVKVFVFLCK